MCNNCAVMPIFEHTKMESTLGPECAVHCNDENISSNSTNMREKQRNQDNDQKNLKVFNRSKSENYLAGKRKVLPRRKSCELLESKTSNLDETSDRNCRSMKMPRARKSAPLPLIERLEEILEGEYQEPIKNTLAKSTVKALQRKNSLSRRQKAKEYIIRKKVDVADKKSVPGKFFSKIIGSLSNVKLGRLTTPSLETIGFDVFSIPEEDLIFHFRQMVKELKLGVVYNNETKLLDELSRSIMEGYKKNPFHNWQHAFSVAQMTVVFMVRNPILRKAMEPKTKLAFLTAALGHDLGHPGNDNSFEIKTKSQIAELYNHQSVLENHHVNQFLNIISDEDKNIFKYLAPSQQLEINQLMVDLVLATDMRFHDAHVEFLQSLQAPLTASALRDPELIKKLLECLLHACDLSGQCMNLHVAIGWEDRIAAEMDAQARKYEQINVEVPPFLRNLNDPRARAGLQLGFINKFLFPLWHEIARVFPNMKPMYENLRYVVTIHYEVLRDCGVEAANEFDCEHYSKHVFETF